MDKLDFEGLVRAMFPHPEYEDNPISIDELCRLRFGVDFADFERIASALLPLTEPSDSPNSSRRYHAFFVDGLPIVRMESIL